MYPPSCVDHTLTPPALKPGCFQPFTLNQDWSAGSGGISLYTVSGLPVRGHTRIALLTDLTPDTLFTDKIGTCEPVSGMIRPVKTQLDPTTNNFHTSTMTTWRGSYGWERWSCTQNGDGGPPGTASDSAGVIGVRTDGMATPVAVQISF